MVSWSCAGQWGAEGIADPMGRPVPGQPVTVTLPDGTTLATLYSDRNKTTTVGNPTPADSNGNLTLWLDPGQYVLKTTVNGRLSAEGITVLPDQAELAGAFQPLNLEGTLAARPAAASVPAKTVYFATDDSGGTLYRSNGTSWAALAPGATATGSVTDLGRAATQTPFSTTSVYSTFVDVSGLLGCVAVVPASGNIRVCFDVVFTNTTNANKPVFQVVDEAAAVIMSGAIPLTAANDQQQRHMERKLTGLTPGATKTYKMQLSVVTSGTAQVAATSGTEASLWVRGA